MKFWTLEILGFIWALPVTVLGVLLILASGGWVIVKRDFGLRFWFVPRHPWWWSRRYKAMCLGFVFLYRWPKLIRVEGKPRQQTIVHEYEHNRQCQIFGPLMIVFYPLACLWALAYGKPYRANFFEIMARWKAGQGLEP